MLFLLLVELALAIVNFMFAPLAVAFPFEIVTPVYTLINYMTEGIRFITYFVFDAAILRAIFTFVITLNAILFGLDLIWRIISYVRLSRDG